jgi:ankyrin repeat protein
MEKNNLGETVLHHLIKSNDNKCAESVLNFIKKNFSSTEKQNFIDAQDNDGNTAFHLATQNKAFDIATLLDIYGANKKIPNKIQDLKNFQ